MEFFIPEQYQEQARLFFDHYELETNIVCPPLPMDKRLFAPKPSRICRFCGKKYPIVGFRSDAHVLSELLGNRYLLSDFECDSCNAVFSKYETHLAPFIGIFRTLHRTKGKNKVPTFKSPQETLRAETTSFGGIPDAIAISRRDVSDDSIVFDESTNTTKITFYKQPYKPLSVYKAVLKMALSCIPQEYMDKYALTREYLRSNKLDDKIGGICRLHVTFLPIRSDEYLPFAAIYKKTNERSLIPTHVFALYFQNLIYQLFIPLYKEDLSLANKDINTYWAPPFFETQAEASEEPVSHHLYELSSKELVRDEMQTLVYQISEEERGKMVGFNLETGEIVEGKPGPTAKILFVKPGDRINL